MPSTYLQWGLGMVVLHWLELLALAVTVVVVVLMLLLRRPRQPSKLDAGGHVIRDDP